MSSAASHSPEKKDSDFFTEHSQVSAHKEYFTWLLLAGGLLTRPRPSVIMWHGVHSLGMRPQEGVSAAHCWVDPDISCSYK